MAVGLASFTIPPDDLIGEFALSCHCTLSLLDPDPQRKNASPRVRSKDSIKLYAYAAQMILWVGPGTPLPDFDGK